MLITDKEQVKDFHAGNRVWQGIPSIARTQGGRMFSTFYTGSTREALGNYSIVVQSDDDGQTWTDAIAVAYGGEQVRCYDPVVWVDPLNRLWFVWNVIPPFGVYASICENPDADELVFGEEFFIAKGVMIQKPTVLSTGEWLFPIAVWSYDIAYNFHNYLGIGYLNSDPEFLEYNRKNTGANVYRSLDCGKTFGFLGGCANIVARNYDEHIIYEKNNGTLVLMSRTNYGMAQSFSYDRGKTWTVAENSGIKSPCTKNFVRRLKSGRLLYVGHYEYTGRNNLTAFLSDDDGESWPYRILLDERDYVSYPDADEGDDGSIYIIYDRARGAFHNTLAKAENSAREVLMAKLREEDIIAGEIVTETSFMKHIVSKLGKYTGEKDLFNNTFTVDVIDKVTDGTVTDYYNDIHELDVDEMLARFDSAADALAYVCDAYPVRCDSLGCLDVKKMNAITARIEAGEGDAKRNFCELVALLAGTNDEATRISFTPTVNRIIECIQKDVKNVPDLATMADEFGISLYYMCHLFKRRTGMSIMQYRDEYRMMLAKSLLLNTQKSITDISAECGFSDSSYFSGKFREREGITPTAYRKNNKI
ncbi:MAG: helix-turn-helix domain-containing protein [Ruminococcaceae bacterium]|nr:helix-turn-helix domain-containing protein [Oscillospiraceae bacterium]